MSYDIYLTDSATGDTLELSESHDLKGGTYALGGTQEAWLNVTYNYVSHFQRVLGEDGIRTIYGMTGEDSLPVLQKGHDALGDDADDDYWKPTEGNAKSAIADLITLAKAAPHGVWRGD